MAENALETEAIRAASRVVKSKKFELPTEIRLRNGILLGVRPMPPLLLSSISASIPEPEVPKVWLEEKDREEENPNHPAYVKAMTERDNQIALATIDVILYACTYIKEVPENMFKPEDDGWLPIPRLAGIKIDPDDEVQRYLAWLRVYALDNSEDLNRAQTLPMQLAGITEAEVEEVMDSFRGGETPGTDSEVPSEIGSTNGNHVLQPNTRSRARN